MITTSGDARPFDPRRLEAWMNEESLGTGPIREVRRLGGGTQNVVASFDRGGRTYIIRLPPAHKRHNSDETMRREARVLAALARTGVPHPELIRACSDESVLGATFYLMEPVSGLNPTIELPTGYRDDAMWRRKLGFALADAASAIAAVDYVAVGLTDLGRPEGYLERQVERWRHELDRYTDVKGYAGLSGLPRARQVGAWLERNRPPASPPGLLHGDLHLANVLCHHDRPAIAAVVDWELATIGDPLVDLGVLLATWPDVDAPIPGLRLEPWSGFPTRQELRDRYAARTDRDISAIEWYEVFGCFKQAVILEGSNARAAAGLVPARLGESMHRSAVALMRRAAQRVRHA